MPTLTKPRCRVDIRDSIKSRAGGIAEYCVQSGLKYTVVYNLLRGFTPVRVHPDIVQRINADTGADMKAWER